ncbi:MAG: exodeoxyribonuclease V subunit gamma, partial [Lysobacterales bacterium]
GMHRGESLAALLTALRGGHCAASSPHLLFGFNHLPPDHLQLLHALSVHAPIHLFHPNPSFGQWGNLATERAIANSRDAETLHLDTGHPLLAALGGHGQTLVAALEAVSDAPGFGEPLDAHMPANGDRLGVLQQSLRELDSGAVLAADASVETPVDTQTDASLRVHVCHTRLREVEALRDAILARMLDGPALMPRDIVVMAPDIEAYAQLLPAVFGDPVFAPWLPYQCADRALGASHPLFARLDRLLVLDRVRFGVDDLLDLLAVPAVAGRFGADQRVLEALAQWARGAGVAWGLDALDRCGAVHTHADGEGDESAMHTWKFALDRVTAGYLTGEDSGLCDGVVPLADAGSSSGAALAVLAELTARLTTWRDALAGFRPVTGWVHAMRQLLANLFEPAPADLDAHDALAFFGAALTSLEEEAHNAGRIDVMPFATLREALRGKLESASTAQPFLGGGITVCGMVPARALPFSMVCILGLNDGEFPRIDRGQGLDLMQAPGAWQRGDRNQRDEDRYLFLEALMSARTTLHLSYRGLDAHSGETLAPAAPLAELIAWLDDASARGGVHVVTADAATPARPWLIEHALQPFAARAFDGSHPALATFQFDPRWHAAATALRGGPQRAPRFVDADLSPPSPDGALSLHSIVRWLREPARNFLRETLGIEQPWFAVGPPEEPLDANLPRASQQTLHAALIEAFWRGGALPTHLPDALRRSGLMPIGSAADAAFADECQELGPSFAALAALDVSALQGAAVVPVDISLTASDAGPALAGRIDFYIPTADTLRRVRFADAQLLGHALADLFEWALLRLTHAPSARLLLWPPLVLANGESLGGWIEPASVSPQQLCGFVSSICARYQQSRIRPLWLPPKTTTALFGRSTDRSSADTRAAYAWRGDNRQMGERDYAQWALLARGAELLNEDDAFAPQLLEDARWLRSTLTALLAPSS